jgi:hypothetical protein
MALINRLKFRELIKIMIAIISSIKLCVIKSSIPGPGFQL